MERYANRGGDSNVIAFEATDSSIKVQFRDGTVYLYTAQSAGAQNVEEMKRLAQQGHGLNSFINRRVKKAYASKSR
ncbi:hypothetical protein ACS5PK_20765 [Roseateles sp. DB2]|uniref:hypothetical protein n=1 Tax=Roseateles sp. DB2 TaxID=3453717 RepID=UPI003EED5E1F